MKTATTTYKLIKKRGVFKHKWKSVSFKRFFMRWLTTATSTVAAAAGASMKATNEHSRIWCFQFICCCIIVFFSSLFSRWFTCSSNKLWHHIIFQVFYQMSNEVFNVQFHLVHMYMVHTILHAMQSACIHAKWVFYSISLIIIHN